MLFCLAVTHETAAWNIMRDYCSLGVTGAVSPCGLPKKVCYILQNSCSYYILDEAYIALSIIGRTDLELNDSYGPLKSQSIGRNGKE